MEDLWRLSAKDIAALIRSKAFCVASIPFIDSVVMLL